MNKKLVFLSIASIGSVAWLISLSRNHPTAYRRLLASLHDVLDVLTVIHAVYRTWKTIQDAGTITDPESLFKQLSPYNNSQEV